MQRIWTPHFLPPDPGDISELSFSAWRVINYIENQSNSRVTHQSLFSKEKFLSCSYDSEPHKNGNVIGEELIYEDQNKLYCCDPNESVDMFEETEPHSILPIQQEKINDQDKKFVIITENMAQYNDSKKKKKQVSSKKITNYFPLTKKAMTHKYNSSPKYLDDKQFHLASEISSAFADPLKSDFTVNFGPNTHCKQLKQPKKLIQTKIRNMLQNICNEQPDNRLKNSGRSQCVNLFFENCPPNNLNRTKNFQTPSDLPVNEDFEQKKDDPLLERTIISEHVKKLDENGFPTCLKEQDDLQTNTTPIISLSNKNSEDIFKELTSSATTEISFTLCYREKICLLNKSNKTRCTPNGILMCSKFQNGTITKIFYSELCFLEEKLRNTLLHVLASFTRKICFEAQAFILYVLDNLALDDLRVCYDWCILDPLIATWLLDPDHPPSSFEELMTVFPEQKPKKCEDWMLNCFNLLEYQSSIMEYLYSELNKQKLWNVFLYLETKIIPILAVMEGTSILVDVEKLKKISSLLNEKLKSIEKSAEDAVGYKFSLNSTQQLRKVLYDELKLDKAANITIKGTSIKGMKSTSEPMLKLLVNIHPLPKLVLDYRQLLKLKTSYTDVILEHAKENKCISSMWDLSSAATGRITSSNPNLQAVPKQCVTIYLPGRHEVKINLRSCFIVQDDQRLISVDFQQIELRVFAILAKDLALLNLFKKEDDIFTTMTQLRLRREDITMEERNQTKTIVYALMYGAGIKRIASIVALNQNEAEKIKKTFLGLFPGLADFNLKILTEARNHKVLRSLSGRKRNFPNILSSNLVLRKSSERQAINFVIQGSAADICKGAMLRAESKLKKKQLKSKLLLQIHDELLWEVRSQDLPIFKDVIIEAMDANRSFWAKKVNIDIPLPVVIRTGMNWGNMTN